MTFSDIFHICFVFSKHTELKYSVYKINRMHYTVNLLQKSNNCRIKTLFCINFPIKRTDFRVKALHLPYDALTRMSNIPSHVYFKHSFNINNVLNMINRV